MRDKLIELLGKVQECGMDRPKDDERYPTLYPSNEQVADYLIANNVFVLPEKLKDSWELALPFMMRFFVEDEAEIEKIKGEFELQKVKQILADIRDYLVKSKEEWKKQKGEINQIMALGVEVFVGKALADLTEYAEKLGVEL